MKELAAHEQLTFDMQTAAPEHISSTIKCRDRSKGVVSISRVLVLEALDDAESDKNPGLDCGRYCAVESENMVPSKHEKNLLTSTSPSGSLRELRAWLEAECEAEQVSIDWTLEYEYPTRDANKGDIFKPGLDTAILDRIRCGSGPRKKVIEDLLAPLRLKSPGKEKELENPCTKESYQDMRDVLLAWNRRMSRDLEDGTGAREALARAFAERDKALSDLERGIKNGEALQQSSQRILDALKGLRPEVAAFKNQDYVNILIILWVNVRATVPDMDDELKHMTMKAIVREVLSRFELTNSRKKSALMSKIRAARVMGAVAEAERLESRLEAFDRKIFEAMSKRLIDKIKLGRRELLKETLKKMLDITIVQAGQKWAAHNRQAIRLMQQSSTCAEANGNVQQVCRQGLEELDALACVAQINAQVLTGLSASLMSRALEPGVHLVGGPTAERKVQVNAHDLVTHVEGSIADIAAAREEARNLLDRMGTMASALDKILVAALAQYREYDGLLELIQQDRAGEYSANGSDREYEAS